MKMEIKEDNFFFMTYSVAGDLKTLFFLRKTILFLLEIIKTIVKHLRKYCFYTGMGVCTANPNSNKTPKPL